jgi:spermidine/putrescine transport system permease protein
MTGRRLFTLLLWCYAGAVFAFIFAPIVVSFIVSFNSDRFPTLPLGEFSTQWYEALADDRNLWPALRRTIVVGAIVAVIATLLGFGAAYTDYRFRFFGKNFYLALAVLPPTIPVVILGLAMLVFLSQIGLFGQLHSVILSHVVLCLPFAMALIRLRLSQMDPAMEAAAWNLGASEWRTMVEIILPFTLPAILSALFITMAVSFDEFAIAFFVSGFAETLPVRILAMFQGQVSPRINAIGSIVFTVTMALVILAQVALVARNPARTRLVAGKAMAGESTGHD